MTIRHSRGLDRRAFLRLSGTAAAAFTAGSLVSCGQGTEADTPSDAGQSGPPNTEPDADNPLNVPPDEPLETVIFKGGYGDQYVIDAQALYAERFPDAEIKHQGGQELGKQLQPRFISGDVPDLIDNSGAGNLPMAALVADGQLMDLTPLLDAPAIGAGGKTVRETLIPGVVDLGSFGGTPHALYYAFVVHGIWHSRSLFEENGWPEPETWDDMLDLCAEIKSTGMSPWTYQGKNPGYILTPILMAAAKAGGLDVLKNIDNLEAGAWTAPPMMAAAEAFYQLVERDYILPGTSGMTHTQAQTYWATGEAAFIPCGSWLESELGDVTPEGFDMVVTTTPAVTASDALPGTAIRGMGSEPYIVPSQAKNPMGGMELLRIMLSPESATNFTDQTQTLTSLADYEPTNVGSGLTSVREALAASGDDTFFWLYHQWYSELSASVNETTSLLMTGEINPDEWAQQCQSAADAVKDDDSVTKFQRD
ncbi:carbohydrate ABC transporter, N-acetylglucosamine/diacetylchitobiose-binding protein [Phytoactinopolyspora alkaliphila]|uniref:Carbohydrate ABC transporter, N-acetylglucosamine/diacetylchitobiose-binding protein n=1 Tax=Phytoactinopolyspora alkaliphila TaxID=1783498 RepID=A0A6N9YNU8_9ACTN|nr:N-acetylglucosamine/diacetylchitobiose ABC transporter substrate-binding protein [Phytoactinopolyspora alkaliphila]NED96610.1 carbohydrate ABC transporter, N-acetylglucosamine/diacetylchitobiose-binding protein [Phytoactinopolyspora alkaliphila]